MADRILTWHITSPGVSLPAFYMERDYIPDKVRIYAEQAPSSGDFEVDIKDDGTSIFDNKASSTTTHGEVYSGISYNTLAISTFKVQEVVTGGTSGAKGFVISDSSGNMKLSVTTDASFSVGETITGGTSLATAVILSTTRGYRTQTYVEEPAKTVAILPKGENLEEHAEDFPAVTAVIFAGSVVTCSVTDMGGANNVTVQLELLTLEESDEASD